MVKVIRASPAERMDLLRPLRSSALCYLPRLSEFELTDKESRLRSIFFQAMFSFPGITQNCIIIEEGNSSIDERRPRQKQYLLKSEAKKNLYDERELISQSTILSF